MFLKLLPKGRNLKFDRGIVQDAALGEETYSEHPYLTKSAFCLWKDLRYKFCYK